VSPKTATFWPILAGVFVTDCATKQIAVDHLMPAYSPHDVIGSIIRFTLAFNPGAAFSMSLGGASRWGFTIAALVALAVLGVAFRQAKPDDIQRSVALALITGGALGNLADRLRSARGVVDFIDMGIGDVRFWTFNVADMGVTCGAALLVWVLWHRGTESDGLR
jgi:signal peptidase II